MANVFMSFLGTSDYVKCNYEHGEKVVEKVRFVQEATLGLFCRDWTEEDRVRIFTTAEALKKNWLDDGHRDFKTGEAEKRQGLKRRIDGLKMPCSVSRVHIPDGGSENEIWEIFQIVFDTLREKDRVVFDITHAFRSIPMLAAVILNYAKVLKKIDISGIYYGAFETLGSPAKARNIPIEERTAPVLDLTPLDLLLEWTFAIDRFKESGDGKGISRLSMNAVTPFLKDSKGRDGFAAGVRNVASALEKFTGAMATCRGLSICETAGGLKKRLDEAAADERVKPLLPLLASIREEVLPFCGDWSKDGFQAAKWCVEHNLIQQAITILSEIIKTRFVAMAGFDAKDREEREFFSKAANLIVSGEPLEKKEPDAAKKEKRVAIYRGFFEENKEAFKEFQKLREYRNDINHAGVRPNPMASDKFYDKIRLCIKRLEHLF